MPFGDTDTIIAPTFGSGDKVVSFGHNDPISPVQELNKTGDVWSQPDTLANVVTAAITGGKKVLGLADKYLLQSAEQLPYSALNLLTFHKPTDPYAKQVLETPLLPSHPEKSLAGTDLATEYNKNFGVPDRVIGALPVVGESIRSLTTPENLMAAGAGLIKGGAQPIVSAFLGKTLEQLPEQVKQAVMTESDPKSTDEQKGAAWAQAGISAGFGGLLTHGLMKTGVTPTILGPEINRDAGIIRDKTFGDLPVNAPVDKPTDQILDTRAQLPEKAGPSQPQPTRFNAGMPGSEAPIDRSQLSPLELQELDRKPNPQYVAPKEKTMETPIIGEHPLTKPLVDLSTAVADLQKALTQQQIQPASQAVTRARDVEGGQISFASPAQAEAIPNARQTAQKTSLVPAVNVDDNTITGRVGETHDDLLRRNGINPSTIPHEDSRRGFVDTQTGKFLSRVEAEKANGVVGTAKASGLDSMDLPGAKETYIKERSNQNAIQELGPSSTTETSPSSNISKVGEEIRPTQTRIEEGSTSQQVQENGLGQRHGLESDSKEYQSLVQQFRQAKPEDKPKLWQNIETLKNKYGGKPPPTTQLVNVTLPGLKVKLDAATLKRQRQTGMVTLPSKEEMGKALETAKAIPGRVLDSIIGHSVDRPIDEIVNHIISKQQGWSAPRHVTVNEEVGNKLVSYAAADTAADQYAKALASEALGDHYKDKSFQDKLGKVIVEERLRALTKYHQDKKEPELASSVTHVMSPTEFDTALKDPEIKAAVERHKAIVQPIAEEQHTSLGGKLAATGPNTGAFANLLAVTDADNFDIAKQLIYGKGNVNPRATVKGSVFEKHATGQAPKYETNYRTVAERMISGNYKRNALRNWIDAGVEAGIYKYAKPGEAIPEMGGQPMTSVPVRIKATPWGSEVTKNLWVRKDLMPEVSQALSGGEKPMKAGMQLLTNLATEAQLIGPTDFVFHTANMYASIVGSLGAKTITRDMARKLTGIKQLDALGRIGYNVYRAILDHPETQKELADIARIGALRDQSQHPTLLSKATGGALDTAKFIRVIDKAGRLARNKMFDNLVERGWVKDTEVDRREFINKMGQYNAKLMSHFQDIAQKYTSQFIVAGRTFNRNAFQRVLMSNEVRAANPSAYWKMKALNMIGVASTLLVVPIIANSLITGKPFGRAGTPVGKVDSGADDEHGRHITYDPTQSELMRRGLRITGGQALFEGVRENKPPTEVMKKMVGDIINGQLNPWQGPPVRVVKGYIEKQAQTHDVGESLKAALAAVNPTITAFMGMDERNDKKGVAGVGQSLEGAVGMGKTRMPTHEEALENIASKYTMPFFTLKDRSSVEKKMKETRPAKTPEEMTSAAKYSIDADARRGSELRKGMDKADLDFVSRRGFEVPGYRDAVNYRGQTVVLKPAEAETLKGLYQASDKMVIDKFKSGRWDNKTPQIQKEIFSELITVGREKARVQMIKQMRAVQ